MLREGRATIAGWRRLKLRRLPSPEQGERPRPAWFAPSRREELSIHKRTHGARSYGRVLASS